MFIGVRTRNNILFIKDHRMLFCDDWLIRILKAILGDLVQI